MVLFLRRLLGFYGCRRSRFAGNQVVLSMAGRETGMIKVFDIGGASGEEVETIRDLLEENGIEYYETAHSSYGPTAAAIWVHSERDHKRAREIIDAMQADLRVKNKSQQADKRHELERRQKMRFLPFAIFVLIILLYMLLFGVTRP